MITLEKIKFSYHHSFEFDLHIDPQQKVAVVGESGVGKSTLLNILAGFLVVEEGKIYLAKENHTYTKPHQRPISMLFQDNNLFNHLTVIENMTLGMQTILTLNQATKEKIEHMAEQVGLEDYLQRYPDELSGGQKQRVALARCMLRNHSILLLDEPFSALDKDLRVEMLHLLKILAEQKALTVVMVTHQPEELKGFVDRVITIKNGKII